MHRLMTKVICFNSCWKSWIKKDGMAIDISDGTITSVNGNVKPKIMMKGWMLLVMWKDGLTSWVNLMDLKASNPIELAEYAVANCIAEELAFKWWVSDTLCKQPEPYYLEGEEEVLEDDAQVWYQVATFHGRSFGDQ